MEHFDTEWKPLTTWMHDFFFSVKIPLFQIFVFYIGRQKLRGLRVLSQTVNGLIEENPLSLRYSNNAHMMMQLK